jgi:low temperature requirement protein LtrA
MTTTPRFLPTPKVSDEGHRVTTFELLFDLVFVFAFTQVTQFMAHEHSALGVLQALVILGILWWSWSSYAWLSNQTHVDEGVVRLGMCLAMAVMFVIALVIPEGFHDMDGGLSGPLVLAVAYLLVRAIHLSLYLLAAGADVDLRRQVLRTSLSLITGSALMIVGAVIGGEAQLWFWIAGLVADIVLTYVTSAGGSWRLHSAGHWAERHGLVVILALGESVVAIGVGAAQQAVSTEIIIGAALAIALSIGLWWLYFDVLAIAAEHILARKEGVGRAQLATDAYTYIHLLLIAGVVISALGVEEAIAHIQSSEAFGLFGSAALLGGTSLYLAGHALFWRRVGGAWKYFRLGGGALLLALIPVAVLVPAIAALGGAVAITLTVVVIETVRYREPRAKIRGAASR